MIFAAYLAQHEKLLQQKYNVSKTIYHKGERGRQREHGLAMFLRENLPAAYGVATGEVIPYKGEKPSPQCDIIIYDRLRMPIFGVNEPVQQVPLEGVYAIIETKSVLDSKAITDAKEKFLKIKHLPRCKSKRPLKRGFRRGPVYLLFGYRLAVSTEACTTFMKEASKSDDIGVVALDRGLGIWLEWPGHPLHGTATWVNTSDEKDDFHETLAYFFAGLLNDLEAMDLGTRSFTEYLGDK